MDLEDGTHLERNNVLAEVIQAGGTSTSLCFPLYMAESGEPYGLLFLLRIMVHIYSSDHT